MRIDNQTMMELVDRAALAEDALVFDYTGRGMAAAYGDQKCFGFKGSAQEFATLLVSAGVLAEQTGDDELLSAFAEWRQDSIGRDTLYYFPRVIVARQPSAKLTLLVRRNDHSVQPPRRSRWTGYARQSEGRDWFEYAEPEGDRFWATEVNGGLIIDEEG